MLCVLCYKLIFQTEENFLLFSKQEESRFNPKNKEQNCGLNDLYFQVEQ